MEIVGVAGLAFTFTPRETVPIEVQPFESATAETIKAPGDETTKLSATKAPGVQV